MSLRIPRVIHQTYHSVRLPKNLHRYRESWRQAHPDWDYRLWTDQDNRALIAEHYPWFLATYDAYPQHIMRVDSARYFILHRFGGLYVDLDFECFKNIEPLLLSADVVLAKEPIAHAAYVGARKRALPFVISNAFMASIAGHEVWSDLLPALVATSVASDVLDATGPYFLTSNVLASKQKSLRLLESETVFPLTNQQTWERVRDSDGTPRAQRAGVFAVHHWHGSWIRPKQRELQLDSPKYRAFRVLRTAKTRLQYLRDGDRLDLPADFFSSPPDARNGTPGLSVGIGIFSKGQCTAKQYLTEVNLLAEAQEARQDRLLSCLMVTRNRFRFAQRAVLSFLQQSYQRKELVIVDDGICGRLQQWLEELKEPQIIYRRLADEGRRLSELQNIGLTHCAGDYVSHWDDDQFWQPQRLALQAYVLQRFAVEACFLSRIQLLFAEEAIIAPSPYRVWERSFMCRLEAVPYYPTWGRNEDSPVANAIFCRGRSALLDYPALCTYTVEGTENQREQRLKRLFPATGQQSGLQFEEAFKKISIDQGVPKDEVTVRISQRSAHSD